ncbi:class II glutamine amidotransferase [Bradyrhizobium sp.]|uniref:class II glutamine amidotransferase n=1 Tax=Bradyrhizobium sp. TaxID=376 RepID=UPI003C778024
MCELLAVSASRNVDVALSLTRLAAHGGSDGQPDGWGAAFLDATDAQVWRDPHPAKDSPWVACLAAHPVSTRLALAHIRRATRGDIRLANTQPFTRELWGRLHVFAHNGMVPDIDRPEPSARFRPLGDTDSEAAFCRFLDSIAETDGTPGVVRDRFANAASLLRTFGPANLMYASADRLLIHADRRRQASGEFTPPGLWLLERHCDASAPIAATAAGMDVSGSAVDVIVVASVPLTNEAWRPLERGTILDIAGGRIEMEIRLKQDPSASAS